MKITKMCIVRSDSLWTKSWRPMIIQLSKYSFEREKMWFGWKMTRTQQKVSCVINDWMNDLWVLWLESSLRLKTIFQDFLLTESFLEIKGKNSVLTRSWPSVQYRKPTSLYRCETSRPLFSQQFFIVQVVIANRIVGWNVEIMVMKTYVLWSWSQLFPSPVWCCTKSSLYFFSYWQLSMTLNNSVMC